MSSNASEQLNVLVRLSSDQAAVQRVTRDIQSVKGEAVQLTSDFGKLGPVAAAGVGVIESKFGLLDEQIALARQELQNFESGLDRVGTAGADSLERITAGARESSEALERLQRETASAGSSGIDTGRIGSIGGQILGGLGQSDAANAVGLVADAAEAITTLNPAMIAMTVASGGLAIAVDQVTKAYQAQIDMGKELATRAIGVSQLVASGTTTLEAQEQIERLRAGYNSLITQSAEALQAANALQDVLASNDAMPTNEFASLRQSILENSGFSSEESLLSYATTIQAQMEALNTSADGLQDAIASGAFAFNDAEAAAAAWADINAQILDQMEAGFNADRERLDFVREIDQATADQRAQLAADLREQRDDLQATVDTFRGSGWDGLPEAEANLARVNEQLEMLGAVTSSTADRMEAARIAQEQYATLYDQQFDAISDSASAAARAAEAQMLYNSAIADSEKKMQDAAADRMAAATKNELALQKSLGDAQSDAADKRIDIERDLGDKLAEVRKNYARSELNAVRDRNADSLEQAQVQRDDQTDAAAKAASKQQEALEKALIKQVQTARERFDEQTRAQRESFDRQLSQLMTAGDREKATRQRALDQANVDLYNAKQIESALNRQFHANEYTMRAQANAIAAIQAYEGGRYAGAQWAAGALVGVTGNQVNTFPPLNAIPTQNVTNVINIGGVGSGQQLTSTQQAQVIGLVRSITAD